MRGLELTSLGQVSKCILLSVPSEGNKSIHSSMAVYLLPNYIYSRKDTTFSPVGTIRTTWQFLLWLPSKIPLVLVGTKLWIKPSVVIASPASLRPLRMAFTIIILITSEAEHLLKFLLAEAGEMVQVGKGTCCQA